MYKVLMVEGVEEFETAVNKAAKEGWRIHSWQDSGGEQYYSIVIVMVQENIVVTKEPTQED